LQLVCFYALMMISFATTNLRCDYVCSTLVWPSFVMIGPEASIMTRRKMAQFCWAFL
jgi:hypothetical protein